MRIAIDARSVFPGRGGIGQYTQNLAANLARVDPTNEYLLFCCTAKGNMRIAQGPNVREAVFETGMMDVMWEQLTLPNELTHAGVDLYHSPMFALPAIRVCPMVVTIHDVVFETHLEWVDERLCYYLRKWARFSAKQAKRIITVSEFSKQEIVRTYGVAEDRVDVTYEAADPRFYPIEDREMLRQVTAKHGLPQEFLLYVGSLEAKKNVENLLAAFRKAKADAKLADQLVLVGGKGGQAMDVDALLEKHECRDDVVLTGYVPDQDLPWVYNAAKAFIYPSLYEGFGLPPLEAMACGVPVICANATSLPEVVGDAAVLVESKDVAEMASAIANVLGDETVRSDLRDKGLARAAAFSWEKTAKQTLEVYRRVMEE